MTRALAIRAEFTRLLGGAIAAGKCSKVPQEAGDNDNIIQLNKNINLAQLLRHPQIRTPITFVFPATSQRGEESKIYRSKSGCLKTECAGGRSRMENYEEFCFRSLDRLQTEGKMQVCSGSSRQQGALSIIRFHGRAVLAPLLSVDQRREMTQYRQRAAQLEADRQSLRRSNLLARVQDIIGNVQGACWIGSHAGAWGYISGQLVVVRGTEGARESEASAPPARTPPTPEPLRGLALLPSTRSPPWGPRDGGAAGARSVEREREGPALPDGTGEGCGEGPEDGGGAAHSLSLQSLLKRSRAYLERERGRRGAWGGSGARVRRQPLRQGERERPGPLPRLAAGQRPAQPDGLLQPAAQPRAQPEPPPPPPQAPPRLRRQHPHLLPCERRRAQPRDGGGEGGVPAAPGALCSPDHPSPAASPPPSAVRLRRGSLSGAGSLCDLAFSVSTSAPSPAGSDGSAPAFRRRSYTLDSPARPACSGPPLDRIPQRAPRLLGGPEPPRAPRRAPAALNQSYDVESPSPALQRPHVTSGPAPSLAKRLAELEGCHEGGVVLSPLATPRKEQHRSTGEVHRRVSALEEARRQMEEQHAQQLSLLIAEQEREQQHLRRSAHAATTVTEGDSDGAVLYTPTGSFLQNSTEMEEKECRLREQGGDQALAGSRTPTQRSLGHRIGYPSLLSAGTPSPAVQSPVSRWGPSRGGGKARSKLSQLLTPELQQALCRLGAAARGFLTRRVLSTEKLKYLRQTILDTREFIHSFQTDALLKRGSLSVQDVSLQERLKVQLRAALYDVHDVFFVMPLGERLELLQQDRQLRAERKLREMEKARSPKGRGVLSAATQRSLDRRKQRVRNAPGQSRKPQHLDRAGSHSTNQRAPLSTEHERVLQPSQGLNAALPGQPHRHGSVNRKDLEEQLKRTDVLKKQNSLG
ncbi:hypothetical protein AAFF_G00100530 [Aldrovandia affinis]|uniref:Centriolar coiled-coil protein of 110 kDa n=1 Tax=Aldrovandia affinis TaxID=143900 RepID=A0AAD7WBK7_9TELE|nr:hypothetical protein AAFF_G00100530 [Aldrovandia affinis]